MAFSSSQGDANHTRKKPICSVRQAIQVGVCHSRV